MCAGGSGGGTPVLFFWYSLRPRNCCGLVPWLPTTCSGCGCGGPLGCKGKRGCDGADCGMGPGPDGKGGPVVNNCCEGGFVDVAG